MRSRLSILFNGRDRDAISPGDCGDRSIQETRRVVRPSVGFDSREMSAGIAESAVLNRSSSIAPQAGPILDDSGRLAPRRPASLQDAGLTLSQLGDFILKSLYVSGSQSGFEIGRELRLPFVTIEETFRFLKDQRCIDVTRGEMLGPVSQRFVLTELGRIRARDALDQCRYVGPAPVPLSKYEEQCRRQTPDQVECNIERLRDAFRPLVIPSELLEELGPALSSGRSIFLYGPPGNGKTVIARAMGKLLNSHGGEIYVPYAILVKNSIVTVFDPAIHQATDDELKSVTETQSNTPNANPSDPASEVDLRWRRIKRPVVITGGELTLEMLELKQHDTGRYYTAPMHVKANGGVFLIDDFGRQLVSPGKLLNRWILPLDEQIDYLTLASGSKVSVPFRQLVMFSTNLNPADLVDDAFLRRIKSRIRIAAPSREVLEQIFHNCCLARDFTFDRRQVDHLYKCHYNRQRLPRKSDPQDLLDLVSAICRFRGEQPRLDVELLTTAAQRFFREV